METARASLVVLGQVLVAASPSGVETAEAIAVGADGRVLASGSRDQVLPGAPGARLLDVRDAAVVPGLHDFHLHLVGMARARGELRLDDAEGPEQVAAAVLQAAAHLPAGEWLRGRGWLERHMTLATLAALERVDVPALLYSHDAHSAWASQAALRAAGIGAGTKDPPGGRIERGADGQPTGVLRERATDVVEPVAGRLRGARLRAQLHHVGTELLAMGVTSVVDAGDTSDRNGEGAFAALGDRASALLDEGEALDGRLRVAVGLPAAGLPAAPGLGVRSNDRVSGTATMRWGWAKAYMDGALGSRTAALFEPYTCGPRDAGIVRLEPAEIDAILRAARAARIGVAMHAIGDRAVADALDAVERAGAPLPGTPPDRVEHLQLVRGQDVPRLARMDVTASIQPVHCASDRALVEECWNDRVARAYPWRAFRDGGVRLASGSDAPIETPNPWHALFAAVHRRFPGDGTPDWRPDQALTSAEGLAALTIDAARAARSDDLGHLRPGALADFAVLDTGLAALLAADERLEHVRAQLTFVDGNEVHRA
ncbi:MAG TPA: amidohydrolase [Candidatus Limnocylindria bacterium]